MLLPILRLQVPMSDALAARYSLHLKDESETDAFALQVARAMLPGHVAAASQDQADGVPVPSDDSVPPAQGGSIHLRGDLGAGKTAFCRALLRACGVTGRIKSPSYALLETYKVSNLYFYHLDFYRFNDPREWLDAGFRDLLRDDALVLIEWPEKAADALPPPDLDVSLEYSGSGRDVTLTALTSRGQKWLNAIVPPKAP